MMYLRLINGQENIPNHYNFIRGDYLSIILTLIVFTLIVVIHEAGHFFVAKKCNVLVEEFAIGMGPKIIGKKWGETLYSIRILPLGGFCRMADEQPADTNRIGFNDATLIQRILICVAGPFMNFVLAFIIMVIMSLCTGIATTEVVAVSENSGAALADIQKGDVITSFDGHSIHTRDELEFYKSESADKTVDIVIKRNGEKIEKRLTPVYDKERKAYLLGVSLSVKAPAINVSGNDYSAYPKGNIVEYISNGYWSSVALVKLTVLGFVKMITAKISVNELSGPIGVTAVVDDAYTQVSPMGVAAVILVMLNFMALLSANLGVINLLPLPAIDGGKILIYIIELITRYRIPKEKEAYIHFIGFVLIMGLGIYIAFNDILKLL